MIDLVRDSGYLRSPSAVTEEDLERYFRAKDAIDAWLLQSMDPAVRSSLVPSGAFGQCGAVDCWLLDLAVSERARLSTATVPKLVRHSSSIGSVLLEVIAVTANKQLQRTVIRRRGRVARAPRLIRQRAAAELRRYAVSP